MFSKLLRDFYDKYLNDYLLINRPERQLVWKWADIQKEDKVLDVGCGYGNFISRARRKGALAYGIDILPENIERAKEISNGFFEVKDISKDWETTHSNFDEIVSISTFEHIHNLDNAISNISKSLKLWGRLIASVETSISFEGKPKGDFPNERVNQITLDTLLHILKENNLIRLRHKYLYKNPLSRALCKFSLFLQKSKLGVLLNLLMFPFIYPLFMIVDYFGGGGYVLVIEARREK